METRRRLGLLWRGDPACEPPSAKADERLGPLRAALADLSIRIEPVVFDEEHLEDVRERVFGLDGVMTWVNPIDDGRNRGSLDALLREAGDRGVWVSAHPDTIARLGSKEVLYSARDLIWGSDVALYRSRSEFEEGFPRRLQARGALVVKQGRGNGGNGVWKVGPVANGVESGASCLVTVQDARGTDGSSEQMTLGCFIDLCFADWEWARCLIDQPFQSHVAEGAVRCYFSFDEVVGFARQWPKRGLLSPSEAQAVAAAPRATVWESVDASHYQDLRHRAEQEWLPQLLERLDLPARSLPAIWDADLLFAGPENSGTDRFVLSEVNTSCVWPFPPTAAVTVASTVVAHLNT